MQSPKATLFQESGQTVVMFAVSIAALLGFMSIVFDAALIFEERRRLQNAADGAALAAAAHLPGSPSTAIGAAETLLAANGYTPGDATVSYQVNISYDGDPEQVEVVVTRLDKPYMFARLLGLDALDISARAVSAPVTSATDAYAVFAIDRGCGANGIAVSGSLAAFDGTVHANANVAVSGSRHSFDPAVTFSCDFTENGSGHTYQRGSKSTGERDVPSAVDGLTYGSFGGCDFTYPNDVNLKAKGEVWQDPQKTQLVDGLYCFGGDVSLSGNDISGNVTFVARGQINVSGSDHDLAAYHPNGVLFFSEADSGGVEIDVAGSGGRWTGLIYASNGDISLRGQGGQNLDGSVIGQNVAISGNGLTIDSNQLAANGNPVVRLIE